MDNLQSPEVEARIAQAKELRQALGSYATGVTVVTTLGGDGRRYGLTANSFSSVSLDPPMVLWSQSVQAPSHPVFRDGGHFVVNVLAEDQVELSARFARWGEDKFAGLETTAGICGAPVLSGCAARFECTTVHRYPGGDHTIFVGKVEHFSRTAKRPLIFAGGKYMAGMAMELPASFADPAHQDLGDVQAVRCAMPEAVALAGQLGETVGVAVWGNYGPTMLRWEQGGPQVAQALRSGLVLPVLTSATGLLFSAHLPLATTRPLMEAEAAADPVARVTLECLPQVLEEVRTRGFAAVRTSALADMYRGEVDAISVPVRNRIGDVILALTAVKRSDDARPDWTHRVAAPLMESAARLSRLLGFVPA